MKKRIFEIGAMMFFVGTMALMSCSEDAGLGFDEEWDDMVPRTKQIYDGGNPNPHFQEETLITNGIWVMNVWLRLWLYQKDGILNILQ